MQHTFQDPISGEICQTPWSIQDAIFHGRSVFMDREGCEICGKSRPKTRYVEDGSCVGCFIKHELEIFNLWLQGMPGRPDPFPTSLQDATDLGLEWYYAHAKDVIVCSGGP